MILVDTSIWINHLNKGSHPELNHLLVGESVLTHPFIMGEIAMGSLNDRRGRLGMLSKLHRVALASDHEVASFVENAQLHGTGLSYIDAHLLAATIAAQDNGEVRLWTSDRKLDAQARRFNVAYTS